MRPLPSFFFTLVAAGAMTSAAPALALSQDVPGVGQPGGPGRVLSPVEYEQWLRGRQLFDEPMHRSRGLGLPELNADSCRACHQDPAVGGAGGLELNVSRFGHDGGDPANFMDLPGGQGLSKLRPPYVDDREEYDPAMADVFEQRQTPSILGAGLIESIPGSAITANEDPTDADMDGIYGVARRLTINSVEEIGRFGWKAQVPTIEDFVRDAMAGELGLTTPDDGRGFGVSADNDGPNDPEFTQSEIDDMAFFMAELGRPLRRNPSNPQVMAGEALFLSIGCAECHTPTLPGAGGPVPLYSNLLLHNVMPTGYRGMAEPGAGVGFFRTPPLWGMRDTAPYMHDGRAENAHEAILAHYGEAHTVAITYRNLPAADQAAIQAFLNDL